MEILKDIILDAAIDCFKMLPFLFAAYLFIEALEHYSGEMTGRILKKVDKAGPVIGAVVGCIPQCGFSVLAANFYAGGLISPGTLLSVFLATSDEAVLIIMGSPGQFAEVGRLVFVKIIIAVVSGYAVDLFLKQKIEVSKAEGELCSHCGCHEEKAGIVLPALRHTKTLIAYLFAFTAILNLCIEVAGIERLSELFLGGTFFQPVAAALVGFIPNCASSVILTQLYLSGVVSFSAVVSGLCTACGVGLLVLFKVNRHTKENMKITGLLFIIAVIAGIILEYMGKFLSF